MPPVSEPPVGLAVVPVAGLPEFGPGDDLAAAVAGAAPWLADGDVVVVTSKVVSKVEGRLVRVPPGADREAARQRAITDETVRVVASRGPLRIVETRHGWVVAAAGIDASNVAGDLLVLLPEDADASARALRSRLRELLGIDVAVVVSDTFGRPWRDGLTDVAVGAAGIPALIDHRGDVDAHGNRLETTQVVRLGAGDLFSYGSRDLLAARAPAPDLVPRAGELDAVADAFRIAGAALPEFPVVLRYGGEGTGVVDVHLSDAVTTTTAINLGAQLAAAIVQLHAEGWTTRWEPVGTPGGSSLVGRLWLGTVGP
jgi:coenzyme F420-0:L-glutamate ligase